MPTSKYSKLVILLLITIVSVITYAVNNRPLAISYTVENLNNYTIHSIVGWDVENDRSIFSPFGEKMGDSPLASLRPGIYGSFALFPRKLPKKVIIGWESREGETKHFSVTRNIALKEINIKRGELVFSILDEKVYFSWVDYERADEQIFLSYGEVLSIDPPPCQSSVIVCEDVNQ